MVPATMLMFWRWSEKETFFGLRWKHASPALKYREEKKKDGMKQYFSPSHLAKTWEMRGIQKESKMDEEEREDRCAWVVIQAIYPAIWQQWHSIFHNKHSRKDKRNVCATLQNSIKSPVCPPPHNTEGPRNNTLCLGGRAPVWSANKAIVWPWKEDYFNLVMAIVVWPILAG